MVIFRGADGKAGYHQADALDDAVRFVERVRNDEGVEAARIFRMQEVPFEFRSYFRVELRPSDGTSGDVPVADETVDAPEASDDAPAEPVPVPVPVSEADQSANGRKGIFSR